MQYGALCGLLGHDLGGWGVSGIQAWPEPVPDIWGGRVGATNKDDSALLSRNVEWSRKDAILPMT